jgi:beta-lactamase class A
MSMPVVEEIERIGTEANVSLSVYARHLESGAELSSEPDREHVMASVYKLPIALALLSMVERGQIRLSDMHAFRRDDLMVGSNLLEPLLTDGGEIHVNTFALIDAALRRSDNAAAMRMHVLVGGPKGVRVWLDEQGLGIGIQASRTPLTNDLLDNFGDFVEGLGYSRNCRPADLSHEHRQALMDRQVPGRDCSTARGWVDLLSALTANALVSAESTKMLLGIMSRCETSANRLRRYLPEHVWVADKTGTIDPIIANDVGLFALPAERGRVGLAVLASSSTADGDRLDRCIAHVGRLVYDYFLLAC